MFVKTPIKKKIIVIFFSFSVKFNVAKTGANKIIIYCLIDKKKELFIDHKELIHTKNIKNRIALKTLLQYNLLIFNFLFFSNKKNIKKNIKIIELTVFETLIKNAKANSKILAKEIEI